MREEMERNMEKVQSVVGVGWMKLGRISIDSEVMGGQP
jgi:hypothetical protein